MTNIAREVQEALGRMAQAGMELEERAAQADPLGYKLSRVMERGKPLSYRWFKGAKTRGRETRYCYAVHRNVAGFYLGWREVVTARRVKRDQWVSRRIKARVIELCEARAKAHRARLAKGRA